MPAPLGKLHYDLWNEVVWLHAKWGQFRQLFGATPERVDLLNRTAPVFFYFLQDVMFEDVLLHICRLTDPPETGRGHRQNLTLLRLETVIEVPQLRTEVAALLQDVSARSAFARDWRNRHIAHRDLPTARGLHPQPLAPASRQHVEDALGAIRAVMNRAQSYYQDSEVAYDAFQEPGDAESLLYYLERGVKAEDEETK